MTKKWFWNSLTMVAADNLDQIGYSTQGNSLDILAPDGAIDRDFCRGTILSCPYGVLYATENGYRRDSANPDWLYLEPTLWVPQRIIEESPTPPPAPIPEPEPTPVPAPTPTPKSTPTQKPVPASKDLLMLW